MRATLFFPLLALALISSAGAQQGSPLACKACWAKCRDDISECKSLPSADMEKLSDLTDAEIAGIGEDHDLYPLKDCLCKLAGKTTDILKLCEDSCPPEMGDGLQRESTIVGNGICNIPKAKLTADEDESTNNGEDKPESGGSNSEEPNSQDKDTPSTGGASSVQWSGALLTVVAAMVSAVAF